MKLINVGFGNMVSEDKIVAIVSPDSAPVKRMVQEAKEKGTAVDATYGRKTKSVIVTNSEMLILCAVTTEAIASRASEKEEFTGKEMLIDE